MIPQPTSGGGRVVTLALFFLIVAFFLAPYTSAATASPSPAAPAAALLRPGDSAAPFHAPPIQPHFGQLKLLNTALVSCTDGSLHGVDRGSGLIRWSLGCGASWPDTSSDAMGKQEECLPFRPVVSASYGPKELPLAEMLAHSEQDELSIYLVEPTAQGELYVLSGSPSALLAHPAAKKGNPRFDSSFNDPTPTTLIKLPLTLPHLVSLSPFTFPGDDSRVFVGSKQARLVEVNVRTGAIRSMFGDSASDANITVASEYDYIAPGTGIFDDDDVWALIGRTDYTLAIHAKNDPQLTQTLHLSLYAPNLADRDVLAAWNSQQYPDTPRIMVIPEDASLLGLNTVYASHTPYHHHSDDPYSWEDEEELSPQLEPVWNTKMSASVASVFDFVQPIEDGQSDTNLRGVRRPALAPHPTMGLGELFQSRGRGPDLDFDADTYIGISDGSLFAMSSVRYPLAELSHPAPGVHSSHCHGLQCMIGSYQSQSAVAGSHGSIDPLWPIWFDPNLGIEGPVSGSREAHKNPTIEPPPGASPGSSQTQPTLPQSGESRVSSVPSFVWGVATTACLMTIAFLFLRPRLRSNPSTALTQPSTEQQESSAGQSVPINQGTPSAASPNGSSTPAPPKANGKKKSKSPTPRSTENPAADPSTAPTEEAASSVKPPTSVIIPTEFNGFSHWSTNAPPIRGALAPSNDNFDPAAVGGVASAVALETQRNALAAPAAPKAKKTRRGKRGGKEVAAKAARAERIATAGSGATTLEPLPEDGYFTNFSPETTNKGPPNVGQSLGPGALPETPAPQSDEASAPSGKDAGAANGVPDRSSTPPASMDPKSEIDSTHPGSNGTTHSSITRQETDADLAQAVPPAVGDESAIGDEPGVADAAIADPQRDTGAHMADNHLFALDGQGQKLRDAAPTARTSSLMISDEVLGYGSSGTVVFKGSFQGRAVAVKRLLKDFTRIASKEVHLLESADDHPNVVRYYYQEVTQSFLYIALELCQATLADVVENSGPGPHQELANLLYPKLALEQIAQGLQHLHGLSIVHRDLKPHNILVTVAPPARSAKYVGVANRKPRLKMLLSDFGLSKKLDGVAQSSFSATVNHPAGTVGWRAPEILRGDVNLESGTESTDVSAELRPPTAGERGEERRRLTRAVDIFAYGCIAYYVLTNGQHPFGSRFERELNVLRGKHDMSFLASLGEEGHEARHLIMGCICPDPGRRPTAAEVLLHPYFWTSHKRLQFLLQGSDAFDTLPRDPPGSPLLALERHATDVLGGPGWTKRVDPLFVADLGKFRSYDPHKVQDLLRAMRNKAHHYQDMSPRLQHILGPLPDGFLFYFTHRFPRLFLHVYSVISSQPSLRSESRFQIFLEGGPNDV